MQATERHRAVTPPRREMVLPGCNAQLNRTRISAQDPETWVREIAAPLAVELQEELSREKWTGDRWEGLFGLEAAADYFGISKWQTEDMIAEGTIEPLWVGRQRRFTTEILEGYLRTHRT